MRPAPPEASREAVRAIRAELARITTLVSKDGYEPALAVARAELARAEEIGWTPHNGEPGGLPRTRFVLAQALWADVATRGLAIEQAERAARELDAAPDEALAKKVDTWLDDRRDELGRPSP